MNIELTQSFGHTPFTQILLHILHSAFIAVSPSSFRSSACIPSLPGDFLHFSFFMAFTTSDVKMSGSLTSSIRETIEVDELPLYNSEQYSFHRLSITSISVSVFPN
ncbi:uncharacterized protein LOC143919152 [Arctopsyche grandis]|uniref:uncharacterized protein LOC143919152 n=1 Tax=Arctopsyche grandis TaxID=121162 RepID=UPI00406D7351